MQDRWSFVGMGASGAGLAAHATLRGMHVDAWYDVDPAVEAAVRTQGGFLYSGIFGEGLLALPPMASEPGELARATTIMVSVTADQHENVARYLASVLTDRHLVVLHCGYVGGGRVFQQALRTAGCTARPKIVETINSLHLSGRPSPAHVVARSHKLWLELSGLASGDAEFAIERIGSLWPELKIGPNALQCGLNNPNSLGHLPVMLGHLGLLNSDHGDLTCGVLHFSEAYTDHIVNLAQAFEKERMAVVRALGLTPLPVADFDALAYPPGTRLEEVLRFGPKLQMRYLTEDLPCDLVPFEGLARLVGCPTPLTTAMIDLVNAGFRCNFRETGRTVEKLGIEWIAEQAPTVTKTIAG
ncbi:NAD/NADP octopine/nopaline dehydrogenase family protein [Rhizobium sp. A37_96]